MKNVVVQVLNNFYRSCRKLLHIEFFFSKSLNVYRCRQGLVSEEPEAHTFKRFEMIIRI